MAKRFINTALAAGEGWVVTGYHQFLKRYITTFIEGNNSNVPVGFYPIIVVDMWSHSYYKDYLNDKMSYLIARMRELDWNVINERFQKAEAIGNILK